jgi:hypothetical protein
MINSFLAFSAEVTAFTTFELQGTGQAQAYLDACTSVVGAAVLGDLLNAYEAIGPANLPDREERFRKAIFGDEKLGPIARNIIKLWYSGGIWNELPDAWTKSYGALERNVTFVVNEDSYPEALIYQAIGANPPGAKAPGYGSWVGPPVIPAVP